MSETIYNTDPQDLEYIANLEFTVTNQKQTIALLKQTIENLEATIASMTAAGAIKKQPIGVGLMGYGIINEVMPKIDPEWKPDLYKKGNE